VAGNVGWTRRLGLNSEEPSGMVYRHLEYPQAVLYNGIFCDGVTVLYLTCTVW